MIKLVTCEARKIILLNVSKGNCNQSMKLEVVAYQWTNNQYCNKFDFFHSEKIYALAYHILQRNVI